MKVAIFALFFLYFIKAFAFTVEIDPNGYTGQYNLGLGVVTGAQTYNLAEGTYNIYFAPSNGFSFSVSSSGVITSLNVGAATVSGTVLTFNTTNIDVDPDAYTGLYNIVGVNNSYDDGIRSFTVIKNISGYILGIAPGVSFRFDVDSSSNVTSQNSGAATGTTGELTFNTTNINIDPGAYSGNYSVVMVNNTQDDGYRTFTVLKNISGYILGIAPGVDFRFDVDGSSNVTSQNTSAAYGSGSTLYFQTTQLRLEVGNYMGLSLVRGAEITPTTGSRDINVVPGLINYILDLSPGTSMLFNVSPNGDVVSQNTNAVSSIGSNLYFNNVKIQVDPGSYTGAYNLSWIKVGNSSGIQEFIIVPGISNYLIAKVPSPSQRFDIIFPCGVTPTPISLGGDDFNLTCLSSSEIESVSLDSEEFNNVDSDFSLTIAGGLFSLSPSDYVADFSGDTVDSSVYSIATDVVTIHQSLKEGRNVINFVGEDSDGLTLSFSDIFWAGSAEVTVETDVASTVELEIEYFDGINTYDFSVSQDTVDNIAVFRNVPQLEGTITVTSTAREVKKRIKVLPETKIKIENR